MGRHKARPGQIDNRAIDRSTYRQLPPRPPASPRNLIRTGNNRLEMLILGRLWLFASDGLVLSCCRIVSTGPIAQQAQNSSHPSSLLLSKR